MTTSILLAKIFGIIYIVAGIGMLANANRYRAMMRDFLNNAGLLFLGGLMALIIGLCIVLLHNVWVASWPVIITLFGWIALVKGVVLLVTPDVLVRKMTFWEKLIPMGGIFVVIIGAVLAYVGFWV